MSDGFDNWWMLQSKVHLYTPEALALNAWQAGRKFGQGDTVMSKPTTQSQVDAYLAERGLVAVPVNATQNIIAELMNGWVSITGRNMWKNYEAMIKAAKEDV